MAFFSTIANYIINLDSKTFYRYIAIYILIYILIFFGIGFLYYSKVNKYINNLENISKKKIETKNIIEDFIKIQKEQLAVQEILDQDKTFRILPAYQDVIKSLKLKEKAEPIITKNPSVKGKIERLLKAELVNLNIKNLVELLSKIANIKQIYPKSLVIRKVTQNKNIDIEITIATLEITEPAI